MVARYKHFFSLGITLVVFFIVLSGCSSPVPETLPPNVTDVPGETRSLPTATLPLRTETPFITPFSTPTAIVPIPTPNPADISGWIAFDGGPQIGDSHIYIIKPDGTELTQLTNTEFYDEFPAWSPDGKYLTFESSGQFGTDIETITSQVFMMELADLTGDFLFTDLSLAASHPSWSPDGKRIAFSGKLYGNENLKDIYIYQIGTRELDNLTNTPDISESHPSWSPDGTRLAFVLTSRDGIGGWEAPLIYIMDVNHPRDLRSTLGYITLGGPKWSPNRDSLVYTCGVRYDICVLSQDDTMIKKLTDAENWQGGYSPSWSPDGSKIVFVSQRDGFENLYIMNKDGSNVVKITDGSFKTYNNPAWQP